MAERQVLNLQIVGSTPAWDSMVDRSWYPSQQFGWNSLHMGWGAFVWLFTCLLWGPWWATGILSVWIAVKEFGYDLWPKDVWPYGEGDDLMSSVTDAFWYQVGGATGAAAWGVLLWCGRLSQ